MSTSAKDFTQIKPSYTEIQQKITGQKKTNVLFINIKGLQYLVPI